MKKIVLPPILTAVLLTSFGTQAADNTEIKARGVIRPSACTPSFAAGDGVIDYGTISARDIKAGQNYVLPSRSVSMAVTCDAPTQIAFRATDNRSASRVSGLIAADDSFNYGLGTDNGKHIGGYAIALAATSTIDNAPRRTSWSRTTGNTWRQNDTDALTRIAHDGTVYALGNNQRSIAKGARWHIHFDVSGLLNTPENLTLTNDIVLDGSTTFEVIYL